MVSKGWTRKILAAESKCDEKTIRNVFAGDPVRDQTVIVLSVALGIEPELDPSSVAAPVPSAPPELFGGYSRAVNKAYEGTYLLYRRTFSVKDGIYRSSLRIDWDEREGRFLFWEAFMDSSVEGGHRHHKGDVYLSAHTNLVHLVTAIEGSVRLMTLSRLNVLDGTMRGCVLTQMEGPMFFQPTISPVFLRKSEAHAGQAEASVVDRSTEEFTYAHQQLGYAESHIVKSAFGASP
jgi:hypothetical protein